MNIEIFNNFIMTAKNIYDEHNIIYKSVNINAKRDENGQIKYKLNGNIEKDFNPKFKYSDVKLNSYFNNNFNGLILMMGEEYNIICIDVDNKNDTIDKYDKLITEEDRNTLTELSMHYGYHYFYRLSNEQKDELNKLKMRNLDGRLFDLDIDVKYTNQLIFGSCWFIENEKEYKTKIINNVPPKFLPKLIYDELIQKINITNKSIKLNKQMKSNIKQEIEPTSPLINQNNKKVENEITNYMRSINPNRFNLRDDWIRLCAICFNEGCDAIFFDLLSKELPKYTDYKDCYKTYVSMKEEHNNKITIDTLKYWAKEDNFNDNYKLCYMNDVEAILDKIFNNDVNDIYISQLLYFYNNQKLINLVSGTLIIVILNLGNKLMN